MINAFQSRLCHHINVGEISLTFAGRSGKVNDHIHPPHWLQVNLQAERWWKSNKARTKQNDPI